jgi:hypothetical protein
MRPGLVEALAEYCQEYLSPYFQVYMESEFCENESLVLGKEHVSDDIMAERNEGFFRIWKARQIDYAKQQMVSPYS